MNVLQLFFGSFHSAAAYRFMRAKANFGMGYALFVVAVCTLFVMLFFGIPVYLVAFTAQGGQPPLFDSIVRQIASQTPVMTLKDDTLATKTPEKTTIAINGSYGKQTFDVPFITIDTTGETTTATVKTPVFIDSKQLYLRNSKGAWEPQLLRDLTKDGPGTIIINHAVAEEWATKIITYTHNHFVEYFIYLWLIFIACFYVVTFFTLLFLGAMGLFMNAMFFKSPLPFGAAVGLAALSFTPVSILNAGLLTFFGYAAHTPTVLLAALVVLFVALQCTDPKRNPAVVA